MWEKITCHAAAVLSMHVRKNDQTGPELIYPAVVIKTFNASVAGPAVFAVLLNLQLQLQG